MRPTGAPAPFEAPTGEARADERKRALGKLATTCSARSGFVGPQDPHVWHGVWCTHLGVLREPKTLWASDKKPREDHEGNEWLTASEFEDYAEVMRSKVTELAKLMRLSSRTVLYTGAGISASVIGQAARSGINRVGWTGCKANARPTFTHHALSLLGQRGLIHGWVQQNHDGLPQKAGFPQERICEVHGSWFDPSNPVVKYSGCLKDRECEWMQRETEAADLVLVLGTSLSGLFADQVVTECAQRASHGMALGACIINLQQTGVDGQMTINLKGKSDDVLALLLEELGLPAPDVLTASSLPTWPEVRAAMVPYDATGKRLPKGSGQPWMWLDLRPGAKIKLTQGHNHQGAKQPNTMHIGASTKVARRGEVKKAPGPGNGSVVERDEASASFKLSIEGAQLRLGIWWLHAAARGGPELLPIVNRSPVFADCKDERKLAALQSVGLCARLPARA